MPESRRPLVAGNWKMHGVGREARALATAVADACEGVTEVDVVLCPPYTSLSAVIERVGDRAVGVGAQNCHWEADGAHTGEISVPMLAALGCRYAIVGHSERRAQFGEDDATVAAKLRACHAGGLTAIACVGETLDERRAGRTLEVVGTQLDALLEVDGPSARDLLVAYEPVWAIGTGQTATPEQAQEVHAALRERIVRRRDAETGAGVRILYGGSVKPENAASLFAMPDIDGGLIGGASLRAETFLPIVEAACGGTSDG